MRRETVYYTRDATTLVISSGKLFAKHPQEKTVVTLNVVLPLNSGDTLNIMMSTETMDEGLGVETITPKGEPTIPSIIVTIVQLD